MSQPRRYSPSYDFSDFQASNPTTPLPGAQVDAQLDAIATTTNDICNNLALVQRDDGQLRNNSVGNDQLKSEVSVGLNAVADWETATAYSGNDGVWEDGALYRCLVAHTSGTFSTDLAAGKWSLIVDVGGEIETLAQPFVDQAQSASAMADTYAEAVSGIGLSFRYEFSTTTTDADPGAGVFRLNNATQTSATELYISDVDGNAANVAALIAKFDDSTSTVKGALSIRNRSNPGQYLEFDVTGLTDATDYTKLTLANGAGSAASPFSNAASVIVGFVPTGDKGDTGDIADINALDSKPVPADADLLVIGDSAASFGTKKTTVAQLLALAPQSLGYRAASTTGSVGTTDRAKLVDASSTITLTFASAATLGAGWYTFIANNGTGDVTVAGNATELDGLASYVMYPGEARLFQCDGTNIRSVVLRGFFRAFTSSGTFVKPPGYQAFGRRGWGGGGGGRRGSTGAGGGGGACPPVDLILVSLVGATETVTIGAGGLPGDGVDGGDGGNTTFGNLFTAYGGAGGVFNSFDYGGAGGGVAGAATSSQGGAPTAGASSTLPDSPDLGGAFGPRVDQRNQGGNSVFGGGSGGVGPATTNTRGGNSVWGGGGGGGGGDTALSVGGTSTYGGNGGNGSDTAGVDAGDGEAPGGAGGGKTGTGGAGAGARGEFHIWGVV